MFYKCNNAACLWDGVYGETRFNKKHEKLCPNCGNVVINYAQFCTEHFLQTHPNYIFVFGDNSIRKGCGGAAKLRKQYNTYGFITKRFPGTDSKAYYTVEEYTPIYKEEMIKLEKFCDKNYRSKILLSKIGSGLANKHNIWENIISVDINSLIRAYTNVYPLWLD